MAEAANEEASERIIPSDYPFRRLSTEQRGEALKEAVATRKFEIELYWKRATYFWAAIATIFVGYFATIGTLAAMHAGSPDESVHSAVVADDLPSAVAHISPLVASLLLAISCAGIVFSIAWYMVNRASSRGQRNWEMHIRYLEPEFLGPLYATKVKAETYSASDIVGPYDFSITRISAALSLGVVGIWVLLGAIAVTTIFGLIVPPEGVAAVGASFAVLWLVVLIRASRNRIDHREPMMDTVTYRWEKADEPRAT